MHRRIAAIQDRNLLTILNLHSVSDGGYLESLNPKLFDELLVFIKENFCLTTFSDAREQQKSQGNSKPKLILSFDDGYKDFVDITMPLLEKHKIKVVQRNYIM